MKASTNEAGAAYRPVAGVEYRVMRLSSGDGAALARPTMALHASAPRAVSWLTASAPMAPSLPAGPIGSTSATASCGPLRQMAHSLSPLLSPLPAGNE